MQFHLTWFKCWLLWVRLWVVAYEEKSCWVPNSKSAHGRLQEWSLKRAFHYKVFKSQFKRGFTKLIVTRAGCLWNESGRKESFSWFVSELTYPSYSYKKRLLLLVVKLSFYIFINNINSRQITDFHYYWKLFKFVSELVSTRSLGVQCQLETPPSFC